MNMLEILLNVDRVKILLLRMILSFTAKNVRRLPARQNTLKYTTAHVILSPTTKIIFTTLYSKIMLMTPNICLVVLTRLERRIAKSAVKIGEIEQETNTESSR